MQNYKQLRKKRIDEIRTKKSAWWRTVRDKELMRIFRIASNTTPAYKDFLKKHHFKSRTVKRPDDLSHLPSITKKNYLRRYSLSERMTNGKIDNPLVFSSTSGSTGNPSYFARDEAIDFQTSIIHELFFRNDSRLLKSPTLVIDCFGMGVWIGGIITYQAFTMMRDEGYPISIITPGINKEEIFRALKNLKKEYPNIILIGYPPFIKDIVDEAKTRKINLKKNNLKIIFAAEAFNEKFRNHICQSAGIQNPLTDTMNIYGTAELGATAFETPLSILIRRLIFKKKSISSEILPDTKRTPTLAQFNPMFTPIQEDDGRLLLSGNHSAPLLRYDIGDRGGVIEFDAMVKMLKKHGIDLRREASKAGISPFWYEMPFMFIYERADMSTTLYGLQIYPEPIRNVLLSTPLRKYFTGKLTLVTKFDRKQNQYLEINLELKKDAKHSKVLELKTLEHVLNDLLKHNSEFRELYEFLGKRAIPVLKIWEAEHPLHFRLGIKQRWSKKN